MFAHTTQGSAEEPIRWPRSAPGRGVLGAGQRLRTLGRQHRAAPAGSTLLVEPWLDGATFNPPTVELRWEEPVHRADFRFRVGGCPAIARGGVRIFVGAVVVGELSLSVRGGERPEPRPLRTSARRFRKVFASYSHADAEVVEAVASAVQLLGDEYLIDSHDLRSGEDWQQRIGELIDDADVFQLFWSSNALQSHFVLAECRHALALRREASSARSTGRTRSRTRAGPPPPPIRRSLLPPGQRTHRAAPAARRPRSPPVPPARPSTAGPPPSSRRGRRLATGGGRRRGDRRRRGRRRRPPGRDHGGGNSAPATTGSDPAAAAPTSVRRDRADHPPVSSDGAAFDRAVAYLGGQAVAQDPSCR